MLLWRVFDRVMFESRGEVFTAFVNNLGDLPPAILAPGLAVFATIAEFALGLALLLGIWHRPVAWASCGLLTLFALAMTFSFGVKAPLNYSVFVDAAAALLLAAWPNKPATRDEKPSSPGTNQPGDSLG